ncbi:MAG: UDP-glucose 4-epimerase GalE [Phycisphaerales bacterium]|nr:UDP-glucose 4-epimerase GalE [Phycisphaerales bacterium]
MRLLVTGGAGYIGSHAALALLEAGHTVTVVDSLDRGHAGTIETLASIGGNRLRFAHLDIRATRPLTALLLAHEIDAVLHFAALAYVGESVLEPLRYYENNVVGGISLLRAMHDARVSRLLFSSTCATYGEPAAQLIPLREDTPQLPVNPYGQSKLVMEQLLRTACGGETPFAVAALRYFNVAGADGAQRIGEDHRPETHLIPLALEVALGKRAELLVYGNDYATQDGTCVRDYVHVTDLVNAHLAALDALEIGVFKAWNVGIGHGYSVLEVLESCRRVTGAMIPARIVPRREGDPSMLVADASAIRKDLHWQPTHCSLDAIVLSAWQFAKRGSVPTA